jgi:PST family polysaccharide transporter
MGIEIVKAIRMQSDKLIVGALLGADALGIYYFAINAGLGIATSFSSVFSTVLFPHLCSSRDLADTLTKAMLIATVLITPIVILQALAAPFYVSTIFGAKWAPVAPMVSILCLAAIPTVIWSAAAQWLRATGRVGTELLYSIAIAVCLIAATIAATRFGLQGVVWAFLAASIVSQLAASMPAILFASRSCFASIDAARLQRT